MTALGDPRRCCSIVCVVPQAQMVAMTNAAQPMQMLWMAPVETQPAAGQLMIDTSMPLYDMSGAADYSWPALQEQPVHPGDANESWLSGEFAPLQFPMDGGVDQLGQYEYIQAPAEMVAWQAAPVEMLQPSDLSGASGTGHAEVQSYEEAPQQVQMEMAMPFMQEAEGVQMEMAMPLVQEAEEVEEAEEGGGAQFDGEADFLPTAVANRQVVSKSTLRRRRRQQAQTYLSEMKQLKASKEDDQSVVDAEDVDHEETEAYVAQANEHADKVLAQLRAGGYSRQAAIAGIENMAFRTKMSSRAAQTAIEKASAPDAAALALGMRGHVRSAVQSKFANYVIQKILETLPVARSSFIVEELLGSGAVLSRHRFGCRIVCRILEHGSLTEGATADLLNEILDSGAEDLCNHTFGSYVIRHFLEFGLPEHRSKIASALSTDVMGFSKQRQGSHVVEAALKFCSAEDQRMLAEQLMGKRDQLMSLASSQFGHHVMKGLLAVPPGELRQEIVDTLRPLAVPLHSTRYGKRVLQALNTASN
mmetsp:Transcript_46017/g.80909  ORF Transcript_46017/g.80909 Transcript_46017/m.80909 type:complete len:532 (+) Transcript_46017:87-1682(+)